MTRLGLGTVQFGLDYGIANHEGRTSEAEAAAILTHATAQGVAVLDTAPAYGEAETVLGRLGAAQRFRIVSKTPYFGSAATFNAPDLRRSIEGSLDRLGVTRLDAILIHHPDDVRGSHSSALFDELLNLKAQGIIGKVGVSIYDADDLDVFGRLGDLDIVQLPLNLLDQRCLRNGTIDRLRARGIEIHVRSIFLQGLVLMATADVPAALSGLKPLLARLRSDCQSAGLSPLAAALAFIRNEVRPDVALVGVDTANHFDEIAVAWSASADFDWPAYAGHDFKLLDPRLWPKTY